MTCFAGCALYCPFGNQTHSTSGVCLCTCRICHPFTTWWAFGFPPFSYCEECDRLWTFVLFLFQPLFQSFGYISRSGISEWYGNCVLTFWRTAKLLSTTFYIPISRPWGFLFLHSLTNDLFSICSLPVTLVGVRWSLAVVLICIFLITKDAECLFMCTWSIQVLCPFRNSVVCVFVGGF